MSKICPFMSKPIHSDQHENFSGYIIAASTQMFEVECLRERCEAWNCKYKYCKLIAGKCDDENNL